MTASSHCPVTVARKLVVANSQILELNSALTGKQHELIVGLPASYAHQPEREYPVVYLLDGYWDFNLVNTLMGGLIYDRVAPELIVVGLSYGGNNPSYDRLRGDDYTPTHCHPSHSQEPFGGGGSRFLEFLEASVLPTIEAQYRVDPMQRVLSGHSLGGLFTLYALFERPDLFRSFLALSPAVGWDERWLFEREKQFRQDDLSLERRVWLSVGDAEWPHFTLACRDFFQQLSASEYPGLELQVKIIEGERHSGVKPESYNRALRFAFAEWAAAQPPA
jgi:predicted alpha/beta superfamily hydrolase